MSVSFAPKTTVHERFSKWQPEPNTRGTWSILSSCIITTFLSVWTAVHVNVPRTRSRTSLFWTKLYWLTIALFAPELVAYAAWYQRSIVTKYHRKLLKLLGQPPPAALPIKIWRWMRSRTPYTDHHEENVSEVSHLMGSGSRTDT